MKLSVVIVNYNVKYFLSTCLDSVAKAMDGIEGEVFVVDNNSSDGSRSFITEKFPEVKWIQNDYNAGFSKANNQAIELSTGDYVLLLNPDTVVEEDCFKKCIDFMDGHPKTGGLGVKMIDGSGRFLPESKRGLPTPIVAFYKIFGLSRLFPKSKKFGAYHLGYLDEDETNEIDVLSGAFMFLRKSVIEKTGGLDESFFMYGEDIDLSYRIVLEGYKNHYFPEAKIIHFKGESTKKSSVNYVLVFYRAMIIFAKKHFSNPNARIFSFLINIAIYFRALIAISRRFAQRIYMPVIDFSLLWLVFETIKMFYEKRWIGIENYYPSEVETVAIPFMALLMVFTQFLFGGYHQPVKMKNVFKGLLLGGISILLLYSMLSEEMRFSRALILLSVVISFLIIPISRLVLNALRLFKLIRISEVRTGIVGDLNEIEEVVQLLNSSPERSRKLLFINPKRKSETESVPTTFSYDASLYQLKDMIRIQGVNELIFCLSSIPAKDLIMTMQKPFMHHMGIYLNQGDRNYMLKSSSVDTIGDFVLPETHPEFRKGARTVKRGIELILSTIMLIISPLIIVLYKEPTQFYRNLINVLSGNLELVGFRNDPADKSFVLPLIDENEDASINQKKQLDYVVNYGIEKDLEVFISKINQLDNEVI